MANKAVSINRVNDLYWKEGLNTREVARELDISIWALYGFMEKNNIRRRSQSETSFKLHGDKPRFILKDDLDAKDEKLKIAGIMLYWAEGARGGNTVDFANSDPQMIRLFLKFLRRICGVKEERLRVYLYVYAKSSVDAAKEYWHNVTGIPMLQFTKPYVREGNQNLSNRKLPHGTVHIRYNDTRLLQTIGGWIKEYIAESR